jgi:hypothetical protein
MARVTLGAIVLVVLAAAPFALASTAASTLVRTSLGRVPASNDPLDVMAPVLAWHDAAFRGGAINPWELFTEDAVYAAGPPCPHRTPCFGPDAIAGVAQRAVELHQVETLIGEPVVVGSLVSVRAENATDPIRSQGYERVVVQKNVTVRDGKIAAWIAFPDLSDRQTLEIQRAGTDPGASTVAVFQEYLRLANSGDSDAAGLLTPDAVVITGAGCPPTAPCQTPETNTARLADGKAIGESWQLLGVPVAAGNVVQVRLEQRNDLQRAAGIERVVLDGQAFVRDGRIVSLVTMPDLSDPQTAQFWEMPQR